jgi:hypothetical protein
MPYSMPDSPPSRFARLKRLQFSLRTMLIVMTLLSILLVFWVLPSERQRRAVKEIDRLGGVWKFHGEATEKGWQFPKSGQSSTIRWWSHYFSNVDAMHLEHAPAATVDWKAFPHVTKIDLLWVTISESEATQISHLKELQSLKLQGCEMNDEAIFSITRSKTLRELVIYGETPIYDTKPESIFMKMTNEKNSIHGRSLLSLNQNIRVGYRT